MHNVLPRESQVVQTTFQVDGVRFTLAKYDKRTPGLFKVEKQMDKFISLRPKMYWCSDLDEKENPKYNKQHGMDIY